MNRGMPIVAAFFAGPVKPRLQCVQVRQQILDLLLVQFLAVARHFFSAQSNDVGDTLVVRRKAAQRKVFVLEDSLEAWTLFAARGVGLVAAIALGVVDLASGGLLRIQTQLGIGFAALDVAGKARRQGQSGRDRENQGMTDLLQIQRTFIFRLHERVLNSRHTYRCEPLYNDSKEISLLMRVAIKRVYEAAARNDGARVLVDRLWPRGLTKAGAAINEWLRDLAPSNELRRWYHARPDHWTDFRKKYLKELKSPECETALHRLYELAHQKKRLTLLFASKNEAQNNAVVLKELLEGGRKPPTGTGPGAAHAMRKRAAARRR